MFPFSSRSFCRHSPAGGDHLRGVLQAGVGDFGAGQHAGDFVGAGAVVEDADAGLVRPSFSRFSTARC